jgi:hypothetical protein
VRGEAEVARREDDAFRQRRRLDAERDWQRQHRLHVLNAHRIPPPFPAIANEAMDNAEVVEIAARLEAFMNTEMYGCRGFLTRNTVMEEFLGSDLVFPHLPNYFLSPAHARIQHHIL